MPAYLLWVRRFDGSLTPQLAFDGDGGRPFIEHGLRGRVASWTPLAASESALGLDEIARRHPPQLGRMVAEDGLET